MNNQDKEITLKNLVSYGGIFFNVEGSRKEKIITNLISLLPTEILPGGKRETLLNAVMEREALMSTGIENGIALPHPRTPILKDGEKPFAAIAFLSEPTDWETPDNKPVHTIFLIVSESPKQHLNALTKINFLCMDKTFFKLITDPDMLHKADKDRIITAIEEIEKSW